MVRKLKHHEQKLLKKTDFITYKQDNGHRDHNVIRRYMIQKPEDYNKYNRLCGVSAVWPGISVQLLVV
jgi:U3 small nucleolar ribonucleoprotein protein IMP3